MFDVVFDHDIECAVWNALGEYARRMDRDAPEGVWHKLLSCDLGFPDAFQDLCSAISKHGELEELVPAAIMRYQRKGEVISGRADKMKYAIRIWQEYSLMGPQLMAVVIGEVSRSKEEQ